LGLVCREWPRAGRLQNLRIIRESRAAPEAVVPAAGGLPRPISDLEPTTVAAWVAWDVHPVRPAACL